MSSEAVVLDLGTGTYFSVNQVGAFVLALIREPRTVATVCREVEAAFEVDTQTCERDVLGFVRRLQEERLIDTVAEA